MRKIILLGILLMVLVSGCVVPEEAKYQDPAEQAKAMCVIMCQGIHDWEDIDKSVGPCISDINTEWNIDDWVCDIAHSPREEVDDLRENQCDGYIGNGGSAEHFVEINENCEVIRVV